MSTLTSNSYTRALGRRAAALACALLLAIASGYAAGAPAQISEHDVKAALVFRTAKFIEWPASAFASEKASFVLCVVGADPAPVASFRALEGKSIGAHAINVRRITGDMLDVRQCHVAFFPRDAAEDIGYAVDKLQGAAVLTIGEDQSFVRRGGILALLTRDERVQFTINLPASRKAALSFNPQLLQLATVLDEDPS